MADAKKYDPETIRTIPVITKPDLIDKGAESSVLDLLLGKKMDTFQMVQTIYFTWLYFTSLIYLYLWTIWTIPSLFPI